MSRIALDDRQRLDWLRLIRTESIGPRSFRALLQRYGGAGAALEAMPAIARAAGRSLRVCSVAEAERELEAVRRLGARLVALGEADYPRPLRAIDSAPPLLLVKGEVRALTAPCVALVGSRNASAAGLAFTARLARAIGEAGFTIVSGLARGIDTAAHEASLATGTVAVLAGGFDQPYPPQNVPLLERLVERGAAVTEMPLGWAPRGRDFPRRNRLVSGLALAVVVVEAARKSGSLITARFANEQGRQIFAVPGSPLDPRSEGGNHLIREGATLCADPNHVIDALAPLLRQPDLFEALDADSSLREEGPRPAGGEALWDELELPDVAPAPQRPADQDLAGAAIADDAERTLDRRLLDLVGPAPVPVDTLVRASGAPVREVTQLLLELELGGLVRRHPDGAISRR